MNGYHSEGTNEDSHRSREHEIYLVNRTTTFLQYQQIQLVPKQMASIKIGRGKNLSGQTFDYLTALYPVGKLKSGGLIWSCECVCGVIIQRSTQRLLNPGTSRNRSCGCKHSAKKLNYEEVIQIKKLLTNHTHKEISEQYPVSLSAITQISVKNNWKHV